MILEETAKCSCEEASVHVIEHNNLVCKGKD